MAHGEVDYGVGWLIKGPGGLIEGSRSPDGSLTVDPWTHRWLVEGPGGLIEVDVWLITFSGG
jgi:hypothetical protein